jgi:hypothetical protein
MNMAPLHPITEQDRQDYARDGVVCLRRIFDADRIGRLRAGATRVIAEPERWGIPGPSQGAMTWMSYLWRTSGIFREFALHSPLGEIVGRVIGAQTIALFQASRRSRDWTISPFRSESIPSQVSGCLSFGVGAGVRRFDLYSLRHTFPSLDCTSGNSLLSAKSRKQPSWAP